MRRCLALSAALFIAGSPCLAQAPNVRAVIFPPQALTVAAAGFTGPCDTASGATVVYGFVSCSAAYAAALNNAADICDTATCTTTATIKFLATGYWDAATAAASAACATDCKVKQFYDSSGNGNAAPVSGTSYGRIVFNALGSCSAITNISGAAFKYVSGAISVASPPRSMVMIASSSGGFGVGGSGVSGSGLGNGASPNYYDPENITTTSSANVFQAVIGISAAGANNSSIVINGAATTGTHSGSTITGGIIGSDSFGGNFVGQLVVGGIWPSAVTGSSMNTTLRALCGGF